MATYGTVRGRMASQRLRYIAKSMVWRLVVGGSSNLKRLMDVVLSSVLLVVLSPLFLLVSVLIKLGDRGPILFWQTRVGERGKRFELPKFRSMVVNAEELKAELVAAHRHKVGITFKLRSDPRTTAIGNFLRKSSIDELPQLWCVLKGDLSMVGPRPALPGEVAAYTLLNRRRLEVRPGLTCMWQVSGRSDIPFARQVELDIQYVDSQSLWLDLLLLLRTIPAVLSGRGAY